jgi:phospholipid N-methyltransferase
MRQRLDDYRVFWREFRQTYYTTGAILPSGRSLAKNLARFVGRNPGPRRILEVGPGTGAVTGQIIAAMGHDDRLDLVERNERFVECLEVRSRQDPQFAPVRDRIRILCQSVEDLPDGQKYHAIVSGLPLNNFPVALVEQLTDKLAELLEPGGTLSFFEYVAIRRIKSVVSGSKDRARLQGISSHLGQLFDRYEFARDCVFSNVPPAWVHHLRFNNDS